MMLAASTAELTIRMLVSLALMGLVALAALKVVRARMGFGPVRSGLAVEARHQLTRTTSVAVVRAGRRHFLVGVSDQGLSLLAEGDDLVVPADEPVEATGAAAPPLAGRGARVRAAGADGEPKSGAGMRHGRASGAASSGMSVIEALRERTVRRS